MTKRRKKWARVKRAKDRITSSVYVAAASPKQKVVLIKTFMAKVFSEKTGIRFKKIDVEMVEKKFNLILTYAQKDSKTANLKDIALSFLAGVLVNEVVGVNLDNVIVDVKDEEGNKKAKIKATIDDIFAFRNSWDPIEFVASWEITKHDEEFAVEEEVGQISPNEIAKYLKGLQE